MVVRLSWTLIGNVRGPTGSAGAAGDSAYQVAVSNGFVGTEEEWLESLIGEQGPAGETGGTGAAGPQGDPGPGVPSGGTTGQVLKKSSDDDFDTEWGEGGGSSEASEVSFDNTESGLAAEDVQAALDEVADALSGLSWTAPNFETANLPPDPPAGELAFDTDEQRLVVGPEWKSVAWLEDVSGGGASRQPGQFATGSLADEASETGVVTLARSFALLSITVDVAAWVRLYQTADALTADASRLITEDPEPGHGVIIDAYLDEAGTLLLSPVPWGNSLESSPSADIPIRVTNKSGGTEVITVDFNVLKVEP